MAFGHVQRAHGAVAKEHAPAAGTRRALVAYLAAFAAARELLVQSFVFNALPLAPSSRFHDYLPGAHYHCDTDPTEVLQHGANIE